MPKPNFRQILWFFVLISAAFLVPPSLSLILHFTNLLKSVILLCVPLALKLILLNHCRDEKKHLQPNQGENRKKLHGRGAIRMDEGELRWQRSGYRYSQQNTRNSGSPKGPNAAGCCSSSTDQDRGQHIESLLLLPSSWASCFSMTSLPVIDNPHFHFQVSILPLKKHVL